MLPVSYDVSLIHKLVISDDEDSPRLLRILSNVLSNALRLLPDKPSPPMFAQKANDIDEQVKFLKRVGYSDMV